MRMIDTCGPRWHEVINLKCKQKDEQKGDAGK
jgi:hypothetical protein